MARPRKPTAALELSGAFAHNPDRKRARANEPVPIGALGDPPEHLDELHKNMWRLMAAEAHWLTSADAFMFEIAVKYMMRFKIGSTDSKCDALLINVLNKLGFGPAERSKISAPGAKKENESEKPKSVFARRKT
jgi:phage terminase small subunit